MNNLIPIEHKSQRVLTTQQLADGYGTETDNISKNYTRNQDHYVQGIHYFILEGDELRAFRASGQIDGLPLNINRMFLWTEKGALLHAKSLNTDRAWEVYSELVETYFHVKELKPQCIEDLIIMQATAMKQLRTEMSQLQSTQQAIKAAVISEPDNWREDINRKLNKISQAVGQDKYQEVRSESYKLLEQRAHVDLERRLNNYRGNLFNAGAGQTAIKKANKLDVIEQDPKLREIYGKIVSEYLIKYVA